MVNEPLEVLVTRKMPDGSYAVVDALRSSHTVKVGFPNADAAVKFIEEFYVARGVLRSTESKQ